MPFVFVSLRKIVLLRVKIDLLRILRKNMKLNVLRYIFVFPLLALLLVACDDAVTYSEMKAKERAAVNRFVKEKGIKVGLIRPITLWPFPTAPIAKAAESCKAFISVELSMGQMIEDVRLASGCKRPVLLCNRTGGMIPSPEEVLDAICKAEKGEF